MPFERREIPPNPPRWQPSTDPATIEIPGLDTTASPNEQIEQIEQLITLKLQNIDENFSKINHMLSTRILPAVKRYAVGTEPVREAAKFWVSFYEQAAQIRIPTYEEEIEEAASERPTEQSDATAEQSTTESSADQHYESDSIITSSSSESSFMPGPGAFASTPATNRQAGANQSSDDASSWSTSLESPLIRLDRELKNFSKADLEDDSINTTQEASTFRREDPPTPPDTARSKGKGREQPEPLLRNLLRHTVLPAGNASSSHTPHLPTSPLRPKKLKTPVAKELNPYLPPNSKPKDWSGVVDLRTPNRFPPSSSRRTLPVKPVIPDDSDDESFDGLPPGMSPPRFMSPARPKPTLDSRPMKIGQTPRREAIARITQDAISDVQSVASGHGASYRYNDNRTVTESTMSTVLTPPSLSRYARDTSSSMDTSLEAMMQRVGLKKGDPESGNTNRNASDSDAWYHQQAQAAGPLSSPHHAEEDDFTMPTPHEPQINYDDDDEDSAFFDDTAHPGTGPSAAFLMASANRGASSDDSDDSIDHDDANIEGLGIAPVHPFARAINLDDSFDDDDSYEADMRGAEMPGSTEEETLFGVPPGERERQAQLRMHGGNLIYFSDDQTGSVAETPTPVMRGQ